MLRDQEFHTRPGLVWAPIAFLAVAVAVAGMVSVRRGPSVGFLAIVALPALFMAWWAWKRKTYTVTRLAEGIRVQHTWVRRTMRWDELSGARLIDAGVTVRTPYFAGIRLESKRGKRIFVQLTLMSPADAKAIALAIAAAADEHGAKLIGNGWPKAE